MFLCPDNFITDTLIVTNYNLKVELPTYLSITAITDDLLVGNRGNCLAALTDAESVSPAASRERRAARWSAGRAARSHGNMAAGRDLAGWLASTHARKAAGILFPNEQRASCGPVGEMPSAAAVRAESQKPNVAPRARFVGLVHFMRRKQREPRFARYVGTQSRRIFK